MSQLTEISIAAANHALDAALNPLNNGFMDWYTDAPVLGTVAVTNGLSAITFSGNQTITAGTIIQFAIQPGVYYTIQSSIAGSPNAVLGVPGGAATPFTGTTAGATTSGLRPATPDVAPFGGNTKLAHLPLSATAFAAASGGSKVANAITSAAAIGTGTATWFRAVLSDTTTGVIDGSLGTSNSDINLSSTAIVTGTTCQCTSWTATLPQ